MADIGVELWRAIFQANDDARDLWAALRPRLNETRVEISTGVREATAIPWELIRDSKTDVPLALRAQAFVRAQPQAAQPPQLPQLSAGPIRILLVICRPGGGEDVPFRSVAARLIKGLSDEARQEFVLDVLRPPTFGELASVLRAARNAGQPYQVLHFDGHGEFFDLQELFAELKNKAESEELKLLRELIKFDPYRFSPEQIYPQAPRPGGRGYLAFENPKSAYNLRLVDGTELAKLLVETETPVLMLNACRSALAEAAEAPTAPEAPGDVHAQVRAFGSLAQEVMDAGVAGVVAMRYNVYVATAAEFVANLYAVLAQGFPLGEAVTLGRKQLHAEPYREIAFNPIPLQDWPVPVVYEAAPIALFPKTEQPWGAPLRITLDTAQTRVTVQGVPPPPDVGFYGRDETLLALDRAFDTQHVVLLHAYAGSGKTATAAEFARWYVQTGGIEGAVLFTSFEQYKPLPRVLDAIEQVFGGWLEQAGVHWLALSDADRRHWALQVLRQIPVLWIWDNVEPVAGFPTGTKSVWSTEEQADLLGFLRDARATKAKFLLISRRDEHGWLGNLPRRLTLPPMPMRERVQLARALTEKYGHHLTEVEDWRPLLRFTQGNPLTITVLVGQALRDGLKTRAQIETFVDKLRKGETAFEDEASEGRSKSLDASLSYGFAAAFTETERRQLALLHLFQGFVDVDVLCWMGNPKTEWCLPEVRGLTREAGMALLDRAAEIGLLTAHGGGYYSIHPALPWYFKSLFEQYYGQTPIPSPSPDTGEGSGVSPSLGGKGLGVRSATRAFVEAMGALGSYYHNEYEDGNRDVIGVLTAEEANLLQARALARTNGWWRRVISTMQGLDQLYDHTGRRAEWARLVAEIVPDFVDPASDGPRPGREEEWGLVTEYRVRLAMEARQWAEAERLQHAQVAWTRRRAAPALAAPPAALDAAQKNAIRTLAVSVSELGNILREQGKAECVAAYEEDYELSLRIGDQPGAAVTAFNLGHVYKNISALRDLVQAEHWYRRSLELFSAGNDPRQAQCLGQLGLVARERFKEASAAQQPEAELLHHLNAALGFYLQVLDLLPPNAVDDLAVTHNQLGNTYADAGDLDRALPHYREAIRYDERGGNLYKAGEHRRNVALALAQAGRFPDALDYAQAALRNFETYGERAAEMIEETRRLIGMIEEDLRKSGERKM